MKKSILLLGLLAAYCSLYAQTDKGDWLIGGSIQLNTTKNNSTIGFSPDAGIFVIKNLAVGGNFNLNYNKAGNTKTTNFGIGPFTRFYFTSANVRPFLHGSISYLSSRTANSNNSFASTYTGGNYFLGGGVAIFINENVSLDGSAGYDHTKYKGIDGSGGLNLHIGFQVYLQKKQVDRLRGE